METKEKLMKAGVVLLVVLSLLGIAKIFSEARAYRFIGSDNSRVATITVNGQADQMVVPDIAHISFGVTSEAAEPKLAQDDAAKKNNAVIAFLKENGVAENDIQSNLALYPKYGNRAAVTCFGCPVNQDIVGYTASYQLQVKVRDLTKVGDLVAGVARLGVTNISGPNFIVDNEEDYRDDLRAKAIADAEAKAKRLAKDLGVKIVRVVDFNEAGGPIYYGKAMMNQEAGMGGDSVVPQVLPGENEIISSVQITYEVR